MIKDVAELIRIAKSIDKMTIIDIAKLKRHLLPLFNNPEFDAQRSLLTSLISLSNLCHYIEKGTTQSKIKMFNDINRYSVLSTKTIESQIKYCLETTV